MAERLIGGANGGFRLALPSLQWTPGGFETPSPSCSTTGRAEGRSPSAFFFYPPRLGVKGVETSQFHSMVNEVDVMYRWDYHREKGEPQAGTPGLRQGWTGHEEEYQRLFSTSSAS